MSTPTLPIEVISHILQFLCLEDQLKVLDKSLVLLRNVGLPRSIHADSAKTLRVILRTAKKYDLVNVLEYILYTETSATKSVLFIASQKGNLKLVHTILSYASTRSIYLGEAIHWAVFFAAQQGHVHVFDTLFPLIKESMINTHYTQWGESIVVPLRFALNFATEKRLFSIIDQFSQIVPIPIFSNNYSYSLGIAAAKGDLDTVERLTQCTRDIESFHFQEALTLAARHGHLTIMERFLQLPEVNVDLLATVNDNYTISVAAENGHVDVVDRLLEMKSVISTGGHWIALVKASRNGHLAIVERILQFFPDMDPAKYSAIEGASIIGSLDIVDRILIQSPKIGENVSVMKKTIMFAFDNSDNMSIVKRLLEIPGVDFSVQERQNMEFRIAAYEGQIDSVNRLLRNPSVDPTANKNKAFLLAVRLGHIAVVERLLEIREVVTYVIDESYWTLKIAAESGHRNVLDRILQLPSMEGRAHSIDLIKHCVHNLDLFERLLQIPGVANSLSSFPFSFKRGNVAVLERLLNFPGVDPNEMKNIAILEAAETGNIAIVERLLQIPGFDAADRENQAIRIAASNGHFDVVDRLLDIPKVAHNCRENNIINGAIKNGHFDIVERILENPHFLDESETDNFEYL